MNERILDICIKAGINTWPFNEVGFISLDEGELVKFAELIIRECAAVAYSYDPLESVSSAIAKLIQTHFGVKE